MPAPAPTAFPGAEGFGATATGGRGGRVLYVTTTAAAGPGSLQWAIDQPGPKTILFKVSGLIDARIHLRSGDVTIAGQSSPGGITVRGFVTDETPFQDQAVRAPGTVAENWILQHIRIRPGLNGPSDDGLRLRYTRNAIVDHVSIGNATDEAVEISYSNNITIQNSLIAETLGGHSFYGGMLLNYSNPAHGFELNNISIHHNVFNRIEGRLPEVSRESLAAAGSTMNLELSSNLYWDPRFFIALAANTGQVTDGRGRPYPVHYRLNAVNNEVHARSTFAYGMWDDQILREPSARGNQLYVSGNRMNLYPERQDYELFYCCNDYPALAEADLDSSARLAQARSERHPFPAITYTAAHDLARLLPGRVGAWPRDPMDSRLMQAIEQRQLDSRPIDSNPAGDGLLPAFQGAPPPAPLDTDNDGLPDAWERSRGLDPNQPSHNGTSLSPLGYTNLEVYLHELALQRQRPAALLTVRSRSGDDAEGHASGRPLSFAVERSGSSTGALTLSWQVLPGGDTAADAADFVGGALPAGTLTLEPGQTTGTVTLMVAGDRRQEPDERVRLRVQAAGDPAVVTAGVRILNDDIIGGPGDEELVGTARADHIEGRGGRDRIRGARGADRFAMRFGDSGLQAPDLITDFRLGVDRIQRLGHDGSPLPLPGLFSRAADNATAASTTALAAAVFADADGALPGRQPLAAHGAALVRASHPAIAGVYVILNNGTASRSNSEDLMVQLQPLGSGPVGALLA